MQEGDRCVDAFDGVRQSLQCFDLPLPHYFNKDGKCGQCTTRTRPLCNKSCLASQFHKDGKLQQMHDTKMSILQHVALGVRIRQGLNAQPLQCYKLSFFVSPRSMIVTIP